MIIYVIVVLIRQKSLPAGSVMVFLSVVVALIAFGITYPYYLGHSSLSAAVIDGKEMFSYAVLAYLAVNKKHFDYRYFVRLFSIVSAILVTVLILSYLTGYCPPGYTQVDDSNVIRVNYSTYISIAAFMLAAKVMSNRIETSDLIFMGYLFTGLFIQGHRSIALTTTLAIILMWCLWTKRTVKIFAALGITMLVLSSMIVTPGFIKTIIAPTSELYDVAGSIESRKNINYVRFLYIAERPLLGYGFIHKSSPLGEEVGVYSTSRFNESLGVVDSGYIDMMVRFGIVGTLMLCGAFGMLIVNRLRRLNMLRNEQIAMVLFLVTLYFVNYTWSVFTYGFGIICSSIAIYIAFNMNDKNADASASRTRFILRI
jgi:O-antigen ligase